MGANKEKEVVVSAMFKLIMELEIQFWDMAFDANSSC
jgi:thiaminase